MSEIKDGGPAFPQSHMSAAEGAELDSGMSLRDWFAGQLALSAMARMDENTGVDDAYIAKRAYEIADAMLAERNKS